MWRLRIKKRLEAAAGEISETLDRTAAGEQQEASSGENERDSDIFSPTGRLHRLG